MPNARRAAMLVLCLAASACVWGVRRERIAHAMPRPTAPTAALAVFAAPAAEYPSVGGDTLKGTSPRDQAAVREAAEREAAPKP